MSVIAQSGEKSQMLQQDLDTDGDEDQPAHQFCAGLIPGAEYIADLDADHGQKKCHSSDETDGGNNVDLQKAKVTPTARASMLVAMARITMT